MGLYYIMRQYVIAASVIAASYFLTANASLGQRELYVPIEDNTHLPPVTGDIVPLPLPQVKEPKSFDSDYNSKWSPSEKHKRSEALLAGMLFGECRGQGQLCMIYVGHVAMNRARQDLDHRYGKGLWGVLNKRKAFSCLNKNDPNRKVIMKGLAGKLKPGTKDAERWDMAKDVAHMLMHRGAEVGDPTMGSTHYHATYMVPKWVKDRGMVKITNVDGHIFYRKDA